MTSNFKYIVAFIISFLFIVFVFQLISMRGLYNTINNQLERSVTECLEVADLYEMQYRVDSLDNRPDSIKEGRHYELSKGVDLNDNNEMILKEKDQAVVKDDTIKNIETAQKTSLAIIDNMSSLIKETLHLALDSLTPPNLAVFNSSLDSSFNEKKIQSKIYKIERIDLNKDSIMGQIMLLPAESNTKTYELIYNKTNKLAYRIYIDPLMKSVLYMMLGSLVSTIAIFLFLSCSFWYLIRTILRLKTLEEMKDDFTNNMTHELKTPLAVAYSATDALLNFRQGDDKERRKEYLTITKEQLEKLSRLVEQILSMSMERRLKLILKKEDVSIQSVLEVLIEQLQMKFERKIVFNVEVQPNNLTVYADKTHLNNVISNLIDNAIKYSKDDVTIDILVTKNNELTTIMVKDNGIGIAHDKQKFLFDKFYRVPQGNRHDAKGYGIGLFYVKTIIEKHGGVIDVVSAVGKGSEFIIKIPNES